MSLLLFQSKLSVRVSFFSIINAEHLCICFPIYVVYFFDIWLGGSRIQKRSWFITLTSVNIFYMYIESYLVKCENKTTVFCPVPGI